MLVTATSRSIRISPSKVRLVLDVVRRMKPDEAVKILSLTKKSAASPVRKTILSVIANAKNNNDLDENTLKFSSLQVSPAATLKRYRATSRGRPHTILKRASHIRIEVEGKKAETKKVVAKKEDIKPETANKKVLKGAK